MFGDTFAFSLTYPQTVNRHGDQNQYPLRVCDLFLCRIQKTKKEEEKVGMDKHLIRRFSHPKRTKKKYRAFGREQTCFEQRAAPSGPLTGKQYWRCGVLRKHTYRVRVLVHVRSHKRMLPARDSRAVAMKVGIRSGVV